MRDSMTAGHGHCCLKSAVIDGTNCQLMRSITAWEVRLLTPLGITLTVLTDVVTPSSPWAGYSLGVQNYLTPRKQAGHIPCFLFLAVLAK